MWFHIFQEILEEKTSEIEKKKNDIISQVKQTTNKLKFTLKGSIVRDTEFLQMALQASRDRLERLETLVEEADDVLIKAAMQDSQVNVSSLLFEVAYNIVLMLKCIVTKASKTLLRPFRSLNIFANKHQ